MKLNSHVLMTAEMFCAFSEIHMQKRSPQTAQNLLQEEVAHVEEQSEVNSSSCLVFFKFLDSSIILLRYTVFKKKRSLLTPSQLQPHSLHPSASNKKFSPTVLTTSLVLTLTRCSTETEKNFQIVYCFQGDPEKHAEIFRNILSLMYRAVSVSRHN